MEWSQSAMGFFTFIILGIIFLYIEKKKKANYKIWYKLLRFMSFSALLWANLLLVLGEKTMGTVAVYILASFVTTIMTIKEGDTNNDKS